MSFCHECSDSKNEQIVDMISFTTYKDHDVDADPIIVLPCGHFFATSNLDRHLEMDQVYETDDYGASFTGLKSLLGSNGSKEPKHCPECRAAIHSVRRYGRFLRLTELRSLERKHAMMAEPVLRILEEKIRSSRDDRHLAKLSKFEHVLRASPMRKVFEACAGATETPPPPAHLIWCLKLKAMAYVARAGDCNDEYYVKGLEAYQEAIDVADSSASARSGAKLRIDLGSFIAKHGRNLDRTREMVYPLLDWVLDHPVQFQALADSARDLKQKLSEDSHISELRGVLQAMNRIPEGAYNYGGSASSHWFECRNGHPFFIGECGGAMQISHCIECGEPVGGDSHSLLDSNRGVTGVIRDALGGL